MQDALLKKLQEARRKYAGEGFLIIGVFGSYARMEENPDSDLDILYEVTPDFETHNPGWDAYERIAKIRDELGQMLETSIDLADRNTLDRIGQYFILPEVIHVA